MDNDKSTFIDNVCTILGGALLLHPLIKQATNALMQVGDEVPKLTSGAYDDKLKMLGEGKEHDPKQENHEKEPEPKEDELTQLRRKLAEYEKLAAQNEQEDTQEQGE